MLEDVQIRCFQAARKWEMAGKLGRSILMDLSDHILESFTHNLIDLAAAKRRAYAYAYHLRETNLASILRKAAELNMPYPQRSVDELAATLEADRQNHLEEKAKTSHAANVPDWPEIDQAIALLKKDVGQFLDEYLKEGPIQASKGIFSVTSR